MKRAAEAGHEEPDATVEPVAKRKCVRAPGPARIVCICGGKMDYESKVIPLIEGKLRREGTSFTVTSIGTKERREWSDGKLRSAVMAADCVFVFMGPVEFQMPTSDHIYDSIKRWWDVVFASSQALYCPGPDMAAMHYDKRYYAQLAELGIPVPATLHVTAEDLAADASLEATFAQLREREWDDVMCKVPYSCNSFNQLRVKNAFTEGRASLTAFISRSIKRLGRSHVLLQAFNPRFAEVGERRLHYINGVFRFASRTFTDGRNGSEVAASSVERELAIGQDILTKFFSKFSPPVFARLDFVQAADGSGPQLNEIEVCGATFFGDINKYAGEMATGYAERVTQRMKEAESA